MGKRQRTDECNEVEKEKNGVLARDKSPRSFLACKTVLRCRTIIKDDELYSFYTWGKVDLVWVKTGKGYSLISAPSQLGWGLVAFPSAYYFF
jgi:hypothetical protein